MPRKKTEPRQPEPPANARPMTLIERNLAKPQHKYIVVGKDGVRIEDWTWQEEIMSGLGAIQIDGWYCYSSHFESGEGGKAIPVFSYESPVPPMKWRNV